MRQVMAILVILTAGLSGCSASHWGGQDAGQTPGVHVRRSLFGGSMSFTGDGTGKVDKAAYKTDGKLTEVSVEGVEFDQTASAVVREQPAKIDAIAGLQRTQVEYVQALSAGIRDIVGEIVPVLKLLAAAELVTTERGITATLPNGITIGQRTVQSAEDLAEILDAVVEALEPLAPASRPTGE